MMLRWLICFTCFWPALLLGGCATSLKMAEVRPGVGVGPVYLGMTMAQVRTTVGEPRVIKPTDDGLSYGYPSMGVTIFGEGEASKVQVITVGLGFENTVPAREFLGKTAEGLGIGTERGRVLATYGPPDESEGSPENRRHQERLVYDRRGITFLLHSGRVVRMMVFPPEKPEAPVSK